MIVLLLRGESDWDKSRDHTLKLAGSSRKSDMDKCSPVGNCKAVICLNFMNFNIYDD